MKLKNIQLITELATILYGVALLVVARLWALEILPLGWIAPAFFYIYETLFVWLFGRYGKMKPQSVLITSMAMRGVKFLGVAVLMLVWVMAKLPAKSEFLLYTLGFYLLTSFFEGWAAKAYAKEMTTKQ